MKRNADLHSLPESSCDITVDIAMIATSIVVGFAALIYFLAI